MKADKNTGMSRRGESARDIYMYLFEKSLYFLVVNCLLYNLLYYVVLYPLCFLYLN